MKKMLYRLLGDRYTQFAYAYRNMLTYTYSVLHPYRYDAKRYEGTFLENEPLYPWTDNFEDKVPRVIYVFWTGDNPITPNRVAGIDSLRRVSGVEVKLITPKELPSYIKPDDPLPEAFQYLSLNHKSDYLRSYFMYHYGGGYGDIKTYFKSWTSAFRQLDASDAYAIGYKEVGFYGAANHDIEQRSLKEDLMRYWHILIGNGAFICKSHTQLAAEWHSEARRRLDLWSTDLKKHPAMDYFGTNEDYPIPWGSMQGEIFHPLCLKYHHKLLSDNALKPSFKNYR
ncbi:MAG: hypothetical protein ACI350_10210 [Prevotella sp.]